MRQNLKKYAVRFHAGMYAGTRVVYAEDEEDAVAIIKRQIRKEMFAPMYSESYRIVKEDEENPG